MSLLFLFRYFVWGHPMSHIIIDLHVWNHTFLYMIHFLYMQFRISCVSILFFYISINLVVRFFLNKSQSLKFDVLNLSFKVT